jgi:uncharacterized membrane protein (UPF0136 family)
MGEVPMAYKVAAVVIGLYGLLSLVGGIIGYAKAGSIPSLAAGAPAGIILLASCYGAFQKAGWSLPVAIVVAVLVGGFFAFNLAKHSADIGEFISSSAGPRTVAMFAGAIVVIASSVAALILD